jgi:hypothetical protein
MTTNLTRIPDELAQVKLTDALRAAIDAALEAGDEAGLTTGIVKHAATLSRLKALGLATADGTLTESGRRQRRWFTDDIALLWDVKPDTVNSYVGTTSLPANDGRVMAGRHVRRWWRPETILEFNRPGMGGPGARILLDVQTIVRQYRSGDSIRAIAKAHGVTSSTIRARLDEAGEIADPTTTESETVS